MKSVVDPQQFSSSREQDVMPSQLISELVSSPVADSTADPVPSSASGGGSGSTGGLSSAGGGSSSPLGGSTGGGMGGTVSFPDLPAYEAIGNQIIALLDQMRSTVPDLFDFDPKLQIGQSSHRGVPRVFVTEAVDASQVVPLLGQSVDMSHTRAGLLYEEVFSLVATKLRKFEQDMTYSINLKRAANGQASLQVYSLAQSLARGGPFAAVLTKYVNAMKKSLGRSGKKKSAGDTTTPPMTTPTPAPQLPAVEVPVPEPPAPNVYVSAIPPGSVR